MKLKKTHRLVAIVKILCDNPNKVLTFSYFTDLFQTAKSTISSDITVIKKVFEIQKLGKVVTISGAAGGVKYIPTTYENDGLMFLQKFCSELEKPHRLLPGGFLYLLDLIYEPKTVGNIARLFTTVIDYEQADYLVTIETKGIPMAIMTARAMNLPLAIIRKNTKISEGPSLSITYVTGKSNTKINSMSLPIKSIEKGSKVIIIDDFMRGGGTLNGMNELMKEFSVKVISSAVIMSTKEPLEKKINNCISLITIEEEGGKIIARPNKNLEIFK